MPARRTTIAVSLAGVALVAVLVAIGVVVAGGDGDGSAHQVDLTDRAGQKWRVELAAPPEATVGTEIEVKISIENTTTNPQTISFDTNRQIELVARDDDGTVVWRSQEPSMKLNLSRSIGGRPSTFARTWATAGVPPGRYTIRGSILAKELAGEGEVERSLELR